MNWYVDTANPEAVSTASRELTAFLRRHADGDSDFGAAEQAFIDLMATALEGGATPLWLELDWTGESPRVCVHDLGGHFQLEAVARPADPSDQNGRGVYVVSDLTKELRIASRRAGGSKVSVVLPVHRGKEWNVAVPRLVRKGLPARHEARKDGTFGEQAFLRALVIQLAQELEGEQGPAAAERLIAQVGTDISVRVEEEYRRARKITERLTPKQMADLFVRLESAISGAFYVVEANDERIVLGNRRCPFGNAVKRAPSLCRVTSSVFGGVAARNSGGSAVELDEQIARGDGECRVIVRLGAQNGGRRRGYVYEPEGTHAGDVPKTRVVLAEDVVFLRDPIARVLQDAEIEVVGHSDGIADLLAKVEAFRPDVALIDFRDASADEALRVAKEIRRRFSETGVLVLTEQADARAARELIKGGVGGVGYLLRQQVTDVREFIAAIQRVGVGGSAIDPHVLSDALGSPGREDRLATLTPREREVLALLAEGLSNGAIAEHIVVTKRAVEKHVKSIFTKLGLQASTDRDRRVLAASIFSKSGT